MQRAKGQKEHSPFSSVHRALRLVPKAYLGVGDKEGVEVVIRRCVEEGVRITLIPPDMPAVSQQDQGE